MPAPSSIVPDTSRRDWTADQLALLPDDGNRYEIVDGELLVTPAPTWTHQGAAGLLYRIMSDYAEPLGLCCVIAPAAVPLSRRTVVEPDVFVVPCRGGGSVPRDLAEAGRLELVVEVLSPSTARADRYVKRRAYLTHGVPECWIVDVPNRTIERWRPGDEEPEVLIDALTWQPIAGAEPLVIDLKKFFARVDGA